MTDRKLLDKLSCSLDTAGAQLTGGGKGFGIGRSQSRWQDLRDGNGQYFDAGRGKKMKEWLALAGRPRLWIELAKEARQFVGTK